MPLDAVACLAAGKCAVLTKGVLNTLMGFSIFAAILLVILILMGFMTPALIFLKAKFKRGSSLVYVVNRGQQGQFFIANSKHQGIADVKGEGPYIITENSHTIEKKSKLPFYFAFGEFASTLPLEFIALVQKLKETDEKFSTIDDLGKYARMKFNEDKKVWEKVNEDKMTEKQKELIKITEVAIKPYKTLKLHDMANMFPYNITPALIESKTQHLIGLKMHMFNKLNMQYVIMFIMILMGATLAAVIAFKFLKTGDVVTATTETRTIIERVVTVGNLTG
ncbi:MAG: hypothetical protein IH934_04715 [Nanoarchaeota archaeon]|nr:hypothetical protein [Nanoarchaeota archaeon]